MFSTPIAPYIICNYFIISTCNYYTRPFVLSHVVFTFFTSPLLLIYFATWLIQFSTFRVTTKVCSQQSSLQTCSHYVSLAQNHMLSRRCCKKYLMQKKLCASFDLVPRVNKFEHISYIFKEKCQNIECSIPKSPF